jgi:hypothetical protein
LTDAERRIVLIQFRKANPAVAVAFDSLLEEYLQFMRIKMSDTAIPFAPPLLIDPMWHAQILSTKAYHAFCDRHNGGDYVHHDPSMVGVKLDTS